MTDVTAVTIKTTLQVQGRTKRWLARRLGMQESYLVAMLNGRKPLQPHHAVKIAEILGIALPEPAIRAH